MPRNRWRRVLAASVGLALTLACRMPTGAATQDLIDLDYAGDASDAHRLDLFLPADAAHAATIVFVHGGAFCGAAARNATRSDACCGVKISPWPSFPIASTRRPTRKAAEDVARATAWIIQQAARHQLDPRNLFLVGHSSGAQIAAVIATDPKYLGALAIRLQAIRGVFAVAGAYDVRDLSGEPDTWQTVDGHIYGETAQARRAFSPAVRIDPNTPPIVTACGTADDPDSCNRATNFSEALRAAGIRSTTIQERGADHMGMLRALVDPKDPLNAALLYFISNLEVR